MKTRIMTICAVVACATGAALLWTCEGTWLAYAGLGAMLMSAGFLADAIEAAATDVRKEG